MVGLILNRHAHVAGTMGNDGAAGRYTFTSSAASPQEITARGMDRPDEEKELVRFMSLAATGP